MPPRPDRQALGAAAEDAALAHLRAAGLRLLERARVLGVQTYLVATPAGLLNVHHELGLDRKALEAHADDRRGNDVFDSTQQIGHAVGTSRRFGRLG